MKLTDGLGDGVLASSKPSVLRGRGRLGQGGDDDNVSPQFRVLILKVSILAAVLVLCGRLFWTQIVMGHYYRALSNDNRAKKVTLHAPRGIIFDRNGQALVNNLPAFRLVDCATEPSGSPCKAQVISKDQAIDLEARGLARGQQLELDSSRFYVFAEATAHILGYVSEVTPKELQTPHGYKLGDRIGRAGVEEYYQDYLRGKDGVSVIEVDALGQEIRTLGTTEPIPGQNLTLNLDWNLQRVAALAMANKSGAVVVTNPANGEVLALFSSPSFNPNVFTDLLLSTAEQSARVTAIFTDQKRPLFDRGVGGTYPPGSTYKIVTATAGLESRSISEDFQVEDTGVLIIGPYKFPNWKYLKDGGTQGTLNVIGALQKSNDIYFYKAGELIGRDNLEIWTKKLGGNGRLGIDLPGESSGTFPSLSWQKEMSKSWYLGDTYHLAIGQGYLLTTPLQVNAWTSVIANGGKLCRPQVLKHFGPPGDKNSTVSDCLATGITDQTLGIVKRGMVAACSIGGTAYPLFNFKVPVACKTGTAEFGDPKNRTHAWLTAFAPADKPEVVITVLVEAGGEGSDVAAPIVKSILEAKFGTQ